MPARAFHHSSTVAHVAFLAWMGLWLPVESAPAQYSPEHPKVQQMVAAGVAYLEKAENTYSNEEYREGAPVLVGYTIFKVTGDIDHPLVKQGLATARRLAQNVNKQRHAGEGKIVYNASMAAVMLASVDAAQYKPELNEILYFIQNAQKPHGGFGYPARDTGDTSQVQYVMLALWTMKEVGIDIPPALVENTLRYLKATIDPSGAWGYQGKVSTSGRPVAQTQVTKSLGTAGIGAMIIGGDVLGFYGARKKKKAEDDPVPEAFVRIDDKVALGGRNRQITMSRSDTDGAIAMAARYQNNSQFSGYWYYYWRYSQERYESFVEIVNNEQSKSPPWYNQGVDELAKFQEEDGSWGSKKKSDITPTPVSTAFSILFLIRSTQKAIGKLDAGLTFGGYQLPTDLSNIKMMGDRIVSDEETSVQSLLEMLEDESAQGIKAGLLPENLQLAKDPTQRKEQVARLSRLLVSGQPEARKVAAKLLGRTDDLSVVPDLIYALTDPDPYVPAIAEESLRLLSRKLNAGELEVKPTAAERAAAEKFWKQWYLGLRPDYIFIDR